MRETAFRLPVWCVRTFVPLLAVLACAFASATPSWAGYASFDTPTDSIQVAGGTVLGSAATYEARIMLLGDAGSGSVYNEWVYGQEDKHMLCSTDRFGAYAFPIDYPAGGINYRAPFSLGVWHHIAYVYDGNEERLYLDGAQVAARPWSNNYNGSHDISDQPNSTNYIGSYYRWDEGQHPGGFVGLLDTMRISDVARYSGASFQAPNGDLTPDAYTQLLYNFNEQPGSTTVTDLSGYGHNGTLGVGFTGATSPEFVPEPSSIVSILCGLLGVVAYRRRAK